MASSMIKQEIPQPIATQPKENNNNIPNPPIQHYNLSSSSGTSSGTSTSSLLSVADDVVDDGDSLLSNINKQQEHENKTKRSRYDLDDNGCGLLNKKPKRSEGSGLGFIVPKGFLAPLPLRAIPPPSLPEPTRNHNQGPAAVGSNNEAQVAAAAVVPVKRACKQFWKAGDYEGRIVTADDSVHSAVGMDHARVHPKFLHSNATSHKWALGAFAELLDNALDEVQHGATYVHVDVLENKKDHTKMLLVEDNGGGMTPDKMRACMSLGYSAKSKMANTIGQYGNGFKTSTMRLGADVIVFSRCQGKDGKSATQSIGLLSYTFLTATGKEDIVVPMIDFEKRGKDWNKKIRSSLNDWDMNLKTILQWSPYASEEDLLQQFNFLKNQGTRIIIYNLWDDDEGNMELCFDADLHDIQIRGIDRDQKNTIRAKRYPNSRHFLTYQHSLRSYASILYLRRPPSFRIILRGEEVEHHNIANDMMHAEDISYKPLRISGVSKNTKNTNMAATGKIGFVKDARHHIDVQGFNVYHKNRLIKPFWRVWNAAGSNGRGVIAVLEANFVEPAHDKQGFERTLALSRLEQRLLVLQKNYWTKQCHLIGYAAKRQLKNPPSDTEQSASIEDKTSAQATQNRQCSAKGEKRTLDNAINQNRQGSTSSDFIISYRLNSCKRSAINDASRGASHDASFSSRKSIYNSVKNRSTRRMALPSSAKQAGINKDGQVVPTNGNVKSVTNFKAENQETSLDIIGGTESHLLENSLQYERDRCQKLQSQLQETISQLEVERKKAEQLEKDNQFLVDMMQDERTKQSEKEDRLMEKFKNAAETIEDLRNRVRQQEGRGTCKIEKC